MFRLFSQTPELLQPHHFVKFESNRDEFCGATHIPANTFWRVTVTQQITFTRSFIIPSGEKRTIPWDNNSDYMSYLNLYPEANDTLYEILVGLKGGPNILLYPIIPATRYIGKLETPYLEVYLADDVRRQISPIRVYDSPADEPKLMVWTVKDMETFYTQFYNEGSDYEKLIMHFIINRCKIERVETVPEKYRVIQDYTLFEAGR